MALPGHGQRALSWRCVEEEGRSAAGGSDARNRFRLRCCKHAQQRGTSLRREELIQLDLDQLTPATPVELRAARRAQIRRVRGKGKIKRTVFLSADAHPARADYLERERSQDAESATTALFVSSAGVVSRAPGGRLSPRAINLILSQIGRWHDTELRDKARRIAPLRPHNLRHTFAFQLAKVTGADVYELERRLGHRSQRYIQRFINPPEAVAAAYIECF